MKNKLIIIVTIIIATILSLLFLKPTIAPANDELTSTIQSPFHQSDVFNLYLQPALPPTPTLTLPPTPQPTPLTTPLTTYQPISQPTLSPTLPPTYQPTTPYQPTPQPPALLSTPQPVEQAMATNATTNENEAPFSFATTYRKVTGPIIYDAVESGEVVGGVCSPVYAAPVCEPACSPVCDSICSPVCDVPLVEEIGCYDDVSCDPAWYSRIKFYGWLQGGLYANSHGSTTQRYQGLNRRGQRELLQQSSGGNGESLGKARQTGAVLNQLWLGLSRELDMRYGFDWGFRGEFLFGTDAWLTQSYGDATLDYWSTRRDYGISIPQLYITMGYMNLSVKVGKFESLLGFEHIQAVDSPFYSHSNLFYAEPQSHSGVLFDYNFNPDFWCSLGYVQGSDSTLSNRFGDNGLLGGIYWRCCPSTTLWYTIYYSKNRAGTFANNEIHTGGDLFRHTFVLNWKLTPRLDYVFQWDIGNRRGMKYGLGNSSYFGWAQYFTYKIHQRLSGGIRIDQLHSNTLMSLSGFARPNTGHFIGNLYGITIGLEWKPYQNFSFKPELRYDYSDTLGTFGKGNKRDQISFGFGIVFDF
jgi:hypothetical protein